MLKMRQPLGSVAGALLILGAGNLWAGDAKAEGTAAKTETAAVQTDAPEVQEVVWLTDFDAAKKQAAEQNLPILIDFTGSDWCPACMRLEERVFSQPEFAGFSGGKFVLVKVDFPRRKRLSQAQQRANEALAEEYGIQYFPTVLVLTPDGKKVTEVQYRGEKIESYLDKLGKGAELALKKYAEDVKTGTDDVVDDTGKGAENVTTEVKKGAESATEEVAKGTEDAAEEVAKGAEDVTTEVKKGAEDVTGTVEKHD